MKGEDEDPLTSKQIRPTIYDEQLLLTKQDEDQPTSEDNRNSSSCFSCSRLTQVIPKRYVIAVLCLWGFANVYALRVNLSVALVAMVSNTTRYRDGVLIQEEAEFQWDPKLQGVILGSFFYGYIFMQIPGGYLASKYGGSLLMGGSVLCTAILTLFIPLAARTHVAVFIALRIAIGLCEGVSFPSNIELWSSWAPPLERSRLATISMSGEFIGTVVSMPLSGVLARNLGWPSVFYVFGGSGILWSIVWFAVVRKSPADDKRLSKEEREYIISTLKETEIKALDIPWKSIVTSRSVWVVAVTFACKTWGMYTLLTELPFFMKNRLGFNIGTTGILSALPFLALSITCLMAGPLADRLLKKRIMGVTAVRKLFTSGFFIEAIFMLIVGVTTNSVVVVLSLMFAAVAGGFTYSGFYVNHLDIAGRYAGVVFGFTNTVATLSGILSPLLTGYIVQHQSVSEWRIVFLLSATMYVVGGIVFVVFSTATTEPWALSGPENKQIIDPDREEIILYNSDQ